MRIKRLLVAAVIVGVALSARVDAAKQRKFKVVVNAANPVASLSLPELSKIFLKGTTSWADGSEITAVDLDPASPVRKAFTKEVLTRDVSEVKVYWQTQIFSGKGVPPVETSSEDDVLAMVGSLPGGIGYVSDGKTLSARVKVIEILD